LQDIGNLLRKEKGDNAFLAKKALQEIESSEDEFSNIVFDSIKHPDEIAVLREKSRNLLTVAVGCTVDERWKRLKKEYEGKELNQQTFENDDKRDAFEDIEYGQKVQLCVDNADISIRNEDHFDVPHKQREEVVKNVEPYINLIHYRTGLRPPTYHESMMAIAYTKALNSSCYKRQVGAVITDENGDVLGIGCNENPRPLGACTEVFGECYRDIYKKQVFDTVIRGTPCPACREEISDDASIEFKCSKCREDLTKYYIQDRGISRCTALHAEESAIINVGGRNLIDCTIYSTTFPCFSCAQKILAIGIKRVFFCEAYPDPDAAKLFIMVKEKYKYEIQVFNFEGVKARAYFRVFGTWRSDMENLVKRKKEGK